MKILKDTNHWIGWIVSAVLIASALTIFNLSVGLRGLFIIFITLTIVDVAKHKLKLQ